MILRTREGVEVDRQTWPTVDPHCNVTARRMPTADEWSDTTTPMMDVVATVTFVDHERVRWERTSDGSTRRLSGSVSEGGLRGQ